MIEQFFLACVASPVNSQREGQYVCLGFCEDQLNALQGVQAGGSGIVVMLSRY